MYVVLPLTLPGIMVGAFLTFVLAIGDYVTPQILGGNNELLLPQLIMLQIGRRGDFPLASALALILMAVVTLAYLACARWLKLRGRDRDEGAQASAAGYALAIYAFIFLPVRSWSCSRFRQPVSRAAVHRAIAPVVRRLETAG